MATMNLDVGQLVYLAQAARAMALGGVIGWERDRSGKPAGLRTHMLVAGCSALLVSLSHIGIEVFEAQLGRPIAGGDPIRVIQTIVMGFSVVGAGTIIGHTRRHVLGLTTATSVLYVATIGICVGLGQVLLAVGATVLGLVVLRGWVSSSSATGPTTRLRRGARRRTSDVGHAPGRQAESEGGRHSHLVSVWGRD